MAWSKRTEYLEKLFQKKTGKQLSIEPNRTPFASRRLGRWAVMVEPFVSARFFQSIRDLREWIDECEPVSKETGIPEEREFDAKAHAFSISPATVVEVDRKSNPCPCGPAASGNGDSGEGVRL